jgi:phenylalanyl-tRNA synthetase alpha chain
MSDPISPQQLSQQIAVIVASATSAIVDSDSTAQLDVIDRDVIGKKGTLTRMTQQLGRVDADVRSTLGAEIAAARQTLTDEIDRVRAGLADTEFSTRLAAEAIDLTQYAVSAPTVGSLHPITHTRHALEDLFIGLGFSVADGPEIEDDFHSFEALNLPPGHPARSGFDTMFVDVGPDESTMLRPHTSPVQIRVMQEAVANNSLPIYAIMPGKVFRRDTPDARHLSTFHQLEGLVVDRRITFGDLAGTIDTFTKGYFGADISSRLRPASFPFTEPSAEFEITCTVCRGQGCRTCSHTGWIELGGCGLVHPNVLTACGIDPEEYSGYAFGFGIDRLLAMKYAIPDIRVMLDNDVRFLSQFA